jgi:hypothetical protein
VNLKLTVFIVGALYCFSAFSYNDIKDENLSLGIKLYNVACKVCHAPTKAKAMKAPVAFNRKVWLKRFHIAKENIKKNFKFKTVSDYMLYQVKVGKGLMHHGGLCEESKLLSPKLDCSNLAYLEAIQYMAQVKIEKKNK